MRLGWPFRVLAPVGWLVIAYGVWGLLADASRTRPLDFAKWFVGALVVHDAVAAPVTFAAGFLLIRLAPPRLRAPVCAGLVVSVCVVLYALPLTLGYGRRPDNPTLQPGAYLPALVGVLVAVWAVAGVWALVRAGRATRPAGR